MPLSHDDIPINLDTEALTDSGFFHVGDALNQVDIDLEQRHARKPAAINQSRELDALSQTVAQTPVDITAPDNPIA